MVGPVHRISNVTVDRFAINDVANYLISLEEDFYKIFGIDAPSLHSLLVDSLQDQSSEYSNPILFFSEDKLLGFYIANAAREILQKRTHDFKKLVKASTRSFCKKDFEKFAPSNLSQFDGVYLSKICVASEYRNTGVGKKILSHFLESNRLRFPSAILHVQKNNVKAKQFYLGNGFDYINTGFANSNYDFMERIL